MSGYINADWCNGSTADSDSVSRGSSPLSVVAGYLSFSIRFLIIKIGAWLSLVERCVRDAEVVGSNPVAPIPWQGQDLVYAIRIDEVFLSLEVEVLLIYIDRFYGG